MNVFDERSCLAALERTGLYVCSINLLWHDALFSANNKVPISWESVEELREMYFDKPASLVRLPLEIGVTPKDLESGAGCFNNTRGQWRRVSSEEAVMAFFSAVARDIEEKGNDAELMQKWQTAMLTCPAHFLKCPDAELEWFAEQRREHT